MKDASEGTAWLLFSFDKEVCKAEKEERDGKTERERRGGSRKREEKKGKTHPLTRWILRRETNYKFEASFCKTWLADWSDRALPDRSSTPKLKAKAVCCIKGMWLKYPISSTTRIPSSRRFESQPTANRLLLFGGVVPLCRRYSGPYF